MEKVLEKAIKKAKAYGLPMIVYENKETNYLDYCSLDVFDSRYCRAIYIILSDGIFEKMGLEKITPGKYYLAGVKSAQFF